jgi:hypothetical protein
VSTTEASNTNILKLKWKTVSNGDGEYLYLGPYKVGSCYFRSLCSREDPNHYEANCVLPGYGGSSVRLPTSDEAKAHVELLVRQWFSKLGITIP